MSDDQAWAALRDAFAGNDAASAGWSQSAPDIKTRCIAYVAKAADGDDRRSRARKVAGLAAAGPIQEEGTGLPEVPEHLRHGFGGLEYPRG
jgi:hypothetical protein